MIQHLALWRYIIAVLDDGDYLNDWLTRFYDPFATTLAYAGMFLAALCGC